MQDEPRFITLAQILRPQGRRGEVLAELLTDFPEQFTGYQTLVIRSSNTAPCSVTVESYWMPTGRNAGRVVLKLAGTDSITDAEKLAGCDIQLPSAERLALDEENYYVDELVGCTLRDGDAVLGEVTEVQFPVTSEGRRLTESTPLFVVQGLNGNEMLIPFANAYVQTIDVAARLIVMTLPAGLAELNG